MSELHELPDDEITKLTQGIPHAENDLQFANFLNDYAAAEAIAAQLMASGEWEISEATLFATVKAVIKQKAQEHNIDLLEFDDPAHPINSKADFEAYAPIFTDFYNSIIDALEEKGRKIV